MRKSRQESGLFTLVIQQPETRSSRITSANLHTERQKTRNAQEELLSRLDMRPLGRPYVVWPVAVQLAICFVVGCQGPLLLICLQNYPGRWRQPAVCDIHIQQTHPGQAAACRAPSKALDSIIRIYNNMGLNPRRPVPCHLFLTFVYTFPCPLQGSLS